MLGRIRGLTQAFSDQVCRSNHGRIPWEVEVPLPCAVAQLHEVQPELVELVTRLSTDRNCAEIIAELCRDGYTGKRRRPYTAASVRR